MKPDERYYVEGPLPETPQNDERAAPWGETKVVGTRQPRIDGYERVSGTAVYTSDVILPDMLHGAMLRCPHGHARVKSVDTSAAEKMPGVRAVIKDGSPGTDIPYYSASLKSRLFDPHCRFAGDEVAAVVAETAYQAYDAVRAIKVDYEVLPFAVTEEAAMKPDASPIHEGSNQVREPQVYTRGDVEAGFKEADVVVEETFTTACQIHEPMERHGTVAKWDGNRLTVWESTQGVYAVHAGVARALGLSLANVRVIGHYMGGAFGSKLGTDKTAVIAALLARMTARPVKLFVTREDSFLAVGNRPPAKMWIKVGAKKDGTITALDQKTTATGGAYATGGACDWQTKDLYLCPNVRTEHTDVYINAGPQRPFRAPGHPQNNWALEQIIDTLADRLKMDPIDLRLKNIPTVSQGREGSPPYTSTGLRECLTEGAKAFGWEEARKKGPGTGSIRRGVGVAAGLWSAGAGGPPSTVIVKLYADGSVNLNMGASDIGTGTKTWSAMIVSEELGVPLDLIQIEHADTGTTQFATPSGGSKTTPTESPAVRAAAIAVRKQLLSFAAEDLKVSADELTLQGREVVSTKDPSKKVEVNSISGFRLRGVVVGVGYREPNPANKATCPFAAHFAEVEVNTRSGEVKVIRYVAAHDSGRVLNRLTYDCQTLGGITMGIGYGLTEERVMDAVHYGKVLNANLHDYKLPTALDVPADMSVVPIDPHDTECNTTGAKGSGEPVTIPVATAVANAVYQAIGVRMTDTPISPLRIVERLSARPRRG